jgi:hypothetical protein
MPEPAEQQQRYVPEILRGEVMHGMGYSVTASRALGPTWRPCGRVRFSSATSAASTRSSTVRRFGRQRTEDSHVSRRADGSLRAHAGISMFIADVCFRAGNRRAATSHLGRTGTLTVRLADRKPTSPYGRYRVSPKATVS